MGMSMRAPKSNRKVQQQYLNVVVVSLVCSLHLASRSILAWLESSLLHGIITSAAAAPFPSAIPPGDTELWVILVINITNNINISNNI